MDQLGRPGAICRWIIFTVSLGLDGYEIKTSTVEFNDHVGTNARTLDTVG